MAGTAAVALLIRLAVIPQDGVINGDGVYYATLGSRLITGDLEGGVSAYWSPLYPLLVGLSSLFFSDLEFAGRFVSAVAGSLLVLPSFLLVADFYGRTPAYLTGMVVAVHPALVRASSWVMADSLYGLVFTTVVWLGWRTLRQGGAQRYFLLGLLVGAAYLTKPEAAGFLALLLGMIVAARLLRWQTRRSVVVGSLLLCTGFTLLALPYISFIHWKTGSWTLSQKLLNNSTAVAQDRGILSLTADGQSTLQDRLFGDAYPREHRRRPTGTATTANAAPHRPHTVGAHAVVDVPRTLRQMKKQLREHLPLVLPHALMLVAAVGFLRGPWPRDRAAREAYLLAFVASTLLGYALTVVELRYAFAMIPILVAWAARGALACVELATRWLSRSLGDGLASTPAARHVLAAAVLTMPLLPLYRLHLAPDDLRRVAFEEKRAGVWLSAHVPASAVIMAGSALPAFYAGAHHLFVPDEPLPVVLDYARRRGVTYLVLAERRLRSTPKLLLADTVRLARESRIVYSDRQAPGYGITVYQLRP